MIPVSLMPVMYDWNGEYLMNLFMKEIKVSFPTLTICMHFGMEMLEKQCGISCSQMILYINILLYFHACCIKMSLPLNRHLRYIHVYFNCEFRSGSTRLILQHCNSVRAGRQVFVFRIRIIWISWSGSEFGPRQAKIVPKKGKNEENFMFEEFSFGLEGFPKLECPL